MEEVEVAGLKELLKNYDFIDMEIQMKKIFPEWDLSLEEIILEIGSGNILGTFGTILKQWGSYLYYEMAGIQYLAVTLMIIGILSAIIVNLKNIFPKQQIGAFSFKYIYLILILFLMNLAAQSISCVKEGLEQLISFLKVFLPTYFIVIGSASGSITAIQYYQIFLFAIYILENVLVVFVLPLIGCYMLICVMNGIWEEERLIVFANMIKVGIQFFLKTILVVVTGSGLMQSLITPVIDIVKTEAMKKTVETIPGVGELMGASLQLIMGVSLLLKNTMGILLFIVLVGICIASMLKVFCIMFTLKLCGGVLGIAADKKITTCINMVGDGISLLLQTVFTAMTFFGVLLLIILLTTNRGLT